MEERDIGNEWHQGMMCDSGRMWGMSLQEKETKWTKRWRRRERDDGESGPPASAYSPLWQASPLGRFCYESWPTFTPLNAFLPQAYIIHSFMQGLFTFSSPGDCSNFMQERRKLHASKCSVGDVIKPLELCKCVFIINELKLEDFWRTLFEMQFFDSACKHHE